MKYALLVSFHLQQSNEGHSDRITGLEQHRGKLLGCLWSPLTSSVNGLSQEPVVTQFAEPST